MQRLNHRTIRNRALETIEDLKWIADNARAIADRANADVDDAINAADYTGSNRGGQELTQPERRGEQRANRPDTTHERMTQLLGTLSLANQSAGAAREIAGKLITSKDERDRAAASAIASAVGTAGQGHCSNCGRWCPGERNDRLKGGRCTPGCYDYWHDHSTERPRELWVAGN